MKTLLPAHDGKNLPGIVHGMVTYDIGVAVRPPARTLLPAPSLGARA